MLRPRVPSPGVPAPSASCAFLERRPTKRHYLVAALALAGAAGATGYYDHVGRARLAEAACVRRGVASFQQLGSYPTVRLGPDAGRPARDVARARCDDNAQAF